MFTGIISHLGKVNNKTNSKLGIQASAEFIKKLNSGLSVSVNGICLTVTGFNKNSFEADFIPETNSRTNLGFLGKGDLVNLELPATSQTFLSGHIIQGHIDGVVKVKNIIKEKNSRILKLSAPKKISKYLVSKGSVALNGISLTVIEVKDSYFSVGIIPHTFQKTMLNKIKEGDFLNIEVDVLAKYVERLLKQ